jgi:hypothetical protein
VASLRKTKITEIRANRFILEDRTGHIRGSLEALENGLVFFVLFGAGRARLAMTIDNDGNPKAQFYNKKGRAVISLGVGDVGHGLTLSDHKGKPLCFLDVERDEIPRIRFFQVTSPTKGRRFWGSPEPRLHRNRKR